MASVKIDTENPRISFARVTLKVDSTETMAKSVDYGDNIDFSDVIGNAQMSLGTTDGVYKTDEGTLELYADDFADLIEQFGDEFYNKTFTITSAYDKSGNSKLSQDELIACRFTKRNVSDQSGGDALTRKLSFKPAYIKWNGKNPLKKMPAGAK